MREIISQLKDLVENACRSEANIFGYRAWLYHITPVVKFSENLAESINADKEICIISALLHDYSSIVNKEYYPEHHIHSARLAQEVLSRLNYPQERIELIKQCILAHRASKDYPKLTKEAQVLADADSMAHFEYANSLFYLAFVVHKMECKEGTEWVIAKLDRSWNRLSDVAKSLTKEKYEYLKKAFTS